jgi:hypothetical protein
MDALKVLRSAASMARRSSLRVHPDVRIAVSKPFSAATLKDLGQAHEWAGGHARDDKARTPVREGKGSVACVDDNARSVLVAKLVENRNVSGGRFYVDGVLTDIFGADGLPHPRYVDALLQERAERAASEKLQVKAVAALVADKEVTLKDGTQATLSRLDWARDRQDLEEFISGLPDLSAFRMGACGDRQPSARSKEALQAGLIEHYWRMTKSQDEVAIVARAKVESRSRIVGVGGLSIWRDQAAGTKLGVAEAFRGKGVALAIKKVQIKCAQAAGASIFDPTWSFSHFHGGAGHEASVALHRKAALEMGLKFDDRGRIVLQASEEQAPVRNQ